MYQCIPLTHWTFAIYYFKVAISTSVFIKWESLYPIERERKQRRSKWIVFALNATFVVTNITALCICFTLSSSDFAYYYAFKNYWRFLRSVMEVLSCTLLMVSILMIR